MKEPSKKTEEKGAKSAHSMSYAGSGMPCLASEENTEDYKTYSEPHCPMEEVVKMPNEAKVNGGCTAVIGMILTRMSEMTGMKPNGETCVDSGRIDTPTKLGHKR